MYGSKSTSPGAAGASGLEARIERIRQNMAAQQARLARGSMFTAIIGAILCALMAFWFYYGYIKIQEVMTPKIIVQAAESTVMAQMPRARSALELQINDSADDWAGEFSKQIQANVPELRVKLEEFIIGKSSESMDQFQVLSATQFRNFVQTNHGMLADGFRSLKKQEEADRFVQDLHSAVEQQLSSDMRSQSEEMLHMLIDLNSKLETLSKGERMNHEQALEREILMISRRLQIETQASQPDESDAASRPAARRRARTAESAGAIAAAGTTNESAADKPSSSPDSASKESSQVDDSSAK